VAARLQRGAAAGLALLLLALGALALARTDDVVPMWQQRLFLMAGASAAAVCARRTSTIAAASNSVGWPGRARAGLR
jgi:hypothetical protein